jgi:hypothetical protein
MAHSNTNPVIEVQDLKKWFPLQGSFFLLPIWKRENPVSEGGRGS